MDVQNTSDQENDVYKCNVHAEVATETVKQPLNQTSDLDSSCDDEPAVKKKKSTTVRGLQKLKAKAVSSNGGLPKRDCHVFSGGVAARLKAFRNDLVRKEGLTINEDSDDIEEVNQDTAFEYKKKRPIKVPSTSSVQIGDDDIMVVSTERAPDVVIMESPSKPRSPSPPPPPAHIQHTKVRRTRDTNRAIASLQNINSFHRLAAISQQYEADREAMVGPHVESPIQREVMVKVRSRSGVQRFPMKPNDRFIEVMKSMASHEYVSLDDVVMYVSGRDTAIQHYDTPSSLNLNVADIVECHVQKKGSSHFAPVQDFSTNVIQIKLQGKDSKSRLTLHTDKNAPLEKIMRLYTKEKNLCFEKLKFKFDDELIDPSQSADDLDMTDDDCIDVIS